MRRRHGDFDRAPLPLSVAAVESSAELEGLGGGIEVEDRIVDLVPLETPFEETRGLLGASAFQRLVKRAIDVLGSALLLLILLPVMVPTAAAILLTSRGPLLFAQERIGKGGHAFWMLKFRSMRRDALELQGDLLHLNTATGPTFKIPADPRITRVGRLIRKLSIDELPQLLNVLRGDMSLVGPRPPLPDEYASYGDRERERLAVKPGLTCIWQVSGRSDVDFDTWVAIDLAYIETWSLGLDLRLLARTVPAVLSGRGAY